MDASAMKDVTIFLLGILAGFIIGMIRAHKWWLVYDSSRRKSEDEGGD